MKVNNMITALFLCTIVLSANALTIDNAFLLDVTLATRLAACVLTTGSSPCNILDIIGGTAAVGTDLTVSASTVLNLAFTQNLQLTTLNLAGAAGTVVSFSQNTSNTVSGTVSIASSNTLNMAGSLTVSGLTTISNSAAFVAQANSNVNFAGGVNVQSTANDNNEGLVVQGGATVTFGAASQIDGALSLAANSALIISSGVTTVTTNLVANGNTTVTSALVLTGNTYTQASGWLWLNGNADTAASGSGTAYVNATVTVSGSSYLRGSGIINGNLNVQSTATAGATLAPGNSPGTIYVNGNFALTSTSTFELEIASANSYDKVIVRGTASINGILAAKLLNNYQPSSGESYTFITSVGGVSGTFNIVRGDFNTNIGKYTVEYNSNSVVAKYDSAATTAVASMLLLAVAFAFASL